MINAFYSNTSYTYNHSEIRTMEADAQRSPGTTANDAMLARLAKNVPGLQKEDVTDLANNDFSPAKIAERISKFVAQGLQNARNEGRSEAEIQAKYDAAIKGVEKGFNEAREILGNLNFLSDDIAAGIDETEALTFEALEAINPTQITTPSLPNYHTQVASVERFSHAESFSLDLTTQDGDTVKILFANQSDQQSAFAYSGDGNGNYSAVYELSQSHSSAFQFHVQGDRDEGELEAIANLISEITEISNEYFNGDVQKAFEIASEFTLDKTELSSMNLQLTKSQTYSAASSYRQVQNNETPNIGKLSGHLVNNFAQAIEQPELDFLENVQSVSQRLLDSLVQQDNRFLEAGDEQKSVFAASLEKIRDIIDAMLEAQSSDVSTVDDIAPAAEIESSET